MIEGAADPARSRLPLFVFRAVYLNCNLWEVGCVNRPAAARAQWPGHHTPATHRLSVPLPCCPSSPCALTPCAHSLTGSVCPMPSSWTSLLRSAALRTSCLPCTTPHARSLRSFGTLRLVARSVAPLAGTNTDERKPRPARARGGRRNHLLTRKHKQIRSSEKNALNVISLMGSGAGRRAGRVGGGRRRGAGATREPHGAAAVRDSLSAGVSQQIHQRGPERCVRARCPVRA